MSVKIILKNSSVEDRRPIAGQLENGEIALNYNEAGAFLTCKDTNGDIQQVGGVKIDENAPGDPVKQTLWFQPSTLSLFVYDGDNWLRIAGGGGGGGGTGDINAVNGGQGIETRTTPDGTVWVDVDLVDTDSGLLFSSGKLGAAIASTTRLGSIKVGDGLAVTADGTLSATNAGALEEVNLGYTPAANQGTVTNDAGTDAVIPVADDTNAGLFTAAEKLKLSGIEDGATANPDALEEVNLGYTAAASGGTVTNDAGTDASIPDATDTTAGLFTGAEKQKLAGIEGGANVGITAITGGTAITIQNDTEINADIATDTTLGVVKAGSGIGITADGTISATGDVTVDLDYEEAADKGTILNTGGTEAVIPLASVGDDSDPLNIIPPVAGLFTGEEKAKLIGIEDGATNQDTNDGRYVKIVGDATAQTITGTGGLKTEGLLQSAGGVKVSGGNSSTVERGIATNGNDKDLYINIDGKDVIRCGYQGLEVNSGNIARRGGGSLVAFSARGTLTEDSTGNVSYFETFPSIDAELGTGKLTMYSATLNSISDESSFGGVRGFAVGKSLATRPSDFETNFPTLAANYSVYGYKCDLAKGSGIYEDKIFSIYSQGTAPNYFQGDVQVISNLYNGAAINSPDAIKCPFISTQPGLKLAQTSTNVSRAAIEIIATNASNDSCNVFNFTKGNVVSSDPSGASNTSDIAGYIRISAPVGAAAGVVFNCGANTKDNGFVSRSDYRLKSDITEMASATERVKLLQPKSYKWIGTDDVVDGFIAHEVTPAVPAAVFGDKDATEAIGTLADYDGTVLETLVTEPSAEELTYTEEVETDGVATMVTRTRTWTATGTRPVYQGVDQTKLIPLLTKALQEALEKIDTLEQRLSDAGL